MSDIKSCFPSRFEGGYIVEADFSQLEVVGLAALSQDSNLIEDLLSGRDMHRYYTAQRLGIPEEEVQPKDRTFTKRMTFQLQYGSGAANMARKLGLQKKDCQLHIDNYYNRYNEVKQWQDSVMDAVARSRKPTDKLTPKGYPQGMGKYESPLGRVYVFFEQDAPEWARHDIPSFSPTQMKNYAVQGSATGDIMALFRARLYRKLLRSPLWGHALLINTVHDSVMADCDSREAAMGLKAMMEETAAELVETIMETWGLWCPVPFKIETKIGPRWSELEKV